MPHATEVRTLGPGTIMRVEDLGPTERAMVMFLANRKPSTLAAYKEDLKQFWAWCEGIPVAPLAVDKIHVQMYLDHLQTIATLDRYLAGRTEGPLFLNQWDNRLTRENVQTILNRSCRNCGITYPVSPHTLRRTHAMTAAEQGADIFSISEDLRHRDPKTTKTYVGKRSGRGARAQRLVSDLMVQMTTPAT